ncbi:hypothetical protein, partial [Ruthenibacterium lactatiformans]
MDELLDEERKASLEQTGRDPPHGETRAGIHRHAEYETAGQRHRPGKHAAAKNGQKTSRKRISPLLRFLIKLSVVAVILIVVFTVPFPVSWTVKMKKKQKETQDILSYH